jgi:excisionase family DNA binding protein
MTMSQVTQTDAVEEWLTVHDACSLIGVSPATLRRWSAAGVIPAFTTPGGHRRFARSTILGLLPTADRTRPNLAVLGQTPEHMTQVYRRHLPQACGGANWLIGLDEAKLDRLRELGRAIATSMLSYLDAPTVTARRTAIHDALTATNEYGRIAARASASISETVEAFQRFRMPFLGELVSMTRRRGLDTVAATDLLMTATQAIDQLLIALISGHQDQIALHDQIAHLAPTRGKS